MHLLHRPVGVSGSRFTECGAKADNAWYRAFWMLATPPVKQL